MPYPVKKGGFVTIWHNQVRNIIATLLNKICNDVQIEPQIEPQLQSLSGDHFDSKTTNNHEDDDWTFRQEDFGVLVKKHYLTKEYSTQ